MVSTTPIFKTSEVVHALDVDDEIDFLELCHVLGDLIHTSQPVSRKAGNTTSSTSTWLMMGNQAIPSWRCIWYAFFWFARGLPVVWL